MRRRWGERATWDRKPAGRAGPAGTTAAKAGWLDLGGARIFTPSPCFNAPNSKHRKVHWTWGKVSNFREKFLRTGKEKGDPSTMLGLEELGADAQSEPSQGISILQWSCVCFYCCRRHCLRQGGAKGAWGTSWAKSLGEKEILVLRQLQKELLNWDQYLGWPFSWE